MPWIYLTIAGIFEIVWSIQLKNSLGFSVLIPSILTVVGMTISIYFLSLALKTLPLGTAYAIWTGIGIVGTVIFGSIFMKEPLDVLRIIFILFIITGVIGLKLFAVK